MTFVPSYPSPVYRVSDQEIKQRRQREIIIKYFAGWTENIADVNRDVQTFVNEYLSEGFDIARHEVLMTEDAKVLVILELSREEEGLPL